MKATDRLTTAAICLGAVTVLCYDHPIAVWSAIVTAILVAPVAIELLYPPPVEVPPDEQALTRLLADVYQILGRSTHDWKGRINIEGQGILAALRDTLHERTGIDPMELQDRAAAGADPLDGWRPYTQAVGRMKRREDT